MLTVLGMAAPGAVATLELLDRAGYVGHPDTRKKNLRRHIAELRDGGYEIESVGPQGHPGAYRLIRRDPQLTAALTPEQRSALREAMIALRLGHVATVLGGDPEPPNPSMGPLVQTGSRPPPALPVIHLALRERRILHFAYNGRPRVVHPIRLVARAHEWQLDAFEPAADKVKTFVLRRMDSVRADEPGGYPPWSGPPVSGDPLDWAVDEPVTATVQVAPEHVNEVRRSLGHPAAERLEDGQVMLQFRVTNAMFFRSRLLALGRRATLLGPPSMVSELLAHLRSVVSS